MRKTINVSQELIDAKAEKNEKIYLTHILTDGFPSGKICLEKGSTGNGGSTLALSDNIPTICAMPFVNVIRSKTEGNPALLGIWNKHNSKQRDISEYLDCFHDGDSTVPKIVVTYDSLPKIMKYLRTMKGDCLLNIPWRLVIDELHLMFNSYKVRKPAIQGVLESIPAFENVVAMTATPIESKYLFKEFKDFDVLEIVYPENNNKIILKEIHGNLTKEIVEVVKDHLEGRKFGNAHIFVNSVRFISAVIKGAGLNNENSRAIVSTYAQSNIDKLSGIVTTGEGTPDSPIDYKIGSINSKAMKINFYSSTAYEGCDVYDSNAVQYMVSDGKNRNTAFDISTTYSQVMGRIRDCPTRKIYHYFTKTRYNSITPEAFEQRLSAEIETANNLISVFEKSSGKEREAVSNIIKKAANETYLAFEHGRPVLDINLVNLENVSYKCVHGDYLCKANISAKIMQQGIKVTDESEYDTLVDEIAEHKEKKITFEERIKEYARIVETPEEDQTDKNNRLAIMEDVDHLLKPAYYNLGMERIEALKYVHYRVKMAVVAMGNHNDSTKIIRMFAYSSGDIITFSERKKRSEEITAELKLTKAVRLQDFYNIKEISVWNKSKGKPETKIRIEGVRIICQDEKIAA